MNVVPRQTPIGQDWFGDAAVRNGSPHSHFIPSLRYTCEGPARGLVPHNIHALILMKSVCLCDCRDREQRY